MPHQCTQCGTTFADGSKEMLSGCPDCGNNKFQYHPGEVGDPPTGGGADADTPSAGSPSAGSSSAGSGPGRDADSPGGSTGSGGSGVTDRVNRATKTVREWVGTDRDGGSGGRGGDRSGGGRTDQSAGAAGAGSPAAEAEAASTEDTAQASARSDVVDPDELPDRQTPTEASADASTDASAGAGTTPAGTESQPSTDDAASAGGAATAGQDAAATPGASETAPTAETPSPAETPEAPEASEGAADENVVEAPEEDTPDLDELRQELNQQFESIKIVEPGQYELNLMELYDREEYIISLKEDGRYAIEVPETWRDDDV